jgi:hypothetical protein
MRSRQCYPCLSNAPADRAALEEMAPYLRTASLKNGLDIDSTVLLVSRADHGVERLEIVKDHVGSQTRRYL